MKRDGGGLLAAGLLAALALVPHAAPAQEPAGPAGEYSGEDLANASGEALRAERLAQAEEDSIVVTGVIEDASHAAVVRQVRDIMVSDNIFSVPLARFETPVCPGVAGLTPQTAATVIDRIRANARTVDLRVQDDGCTPNIILAIVDDGQAMLARMIENNPARFQYLTTAEQRWMLEPGPARAWTDIQPANRDGFPMARERGLFNPPRIANQMAHSLIYTANRNDIVLVYVILDRDAVRGLSLQQLADYATMRALVQTRPRADLGISSILGLFNPDGPWPEGLTDFDRAYLASAYSGIPNVPAAMRVGRVASELRAIEERREGAE